MTSQDMLEEIGSLRTEMGALSDHMVRLRYADIKSAFLEQIRMAVGEEGRKAFLSDAPVLTEASQCEMKTICMNKLEETVDIASGLFMKEDLEGAIGVLNSVDDLISGECSNCQDLECSRGARETIRRVKTIMEVYGSLSSRLGRTAEATAPPEFKEALSPEVAEGVIDPLANGWRIKVLIALRRSDRSLSELGKAVDLRTGHLQFHLRALIGAGYVQQDRRKHLYRLTERGDMALQWTEDIVQRLGPYPAEANEGHR